MSAEWRDQRSGPGRRYEDDDHASGRRRSRSRERYREDARRRAEPSRDSHIPRREDSLEAERRRQDSRRAYRRTPDEDSRSYRGSDSRLYGDGDRQASRRLAAPRVPSPELPRRGGPDAYEDKGERDGRRGGERRDDGRRGSRPSSLSRMSRPSYSRGEELPHQSRYHRSSRPPRDGAAGDYGTSSASGLTARDREDYSGSAVRDRRRDCGDASREGPRRVSRSPVDRSRVRGDDLAGGRRSDEASRRKDNEGDESMSSSDDDEESEDLTEDQLLGKLMGITEFDTTQGKCHKNSDASGVNKKTTRKYRQYMNRRGGFNRPLSPIH